MSEIRVTSDSLDAANAAANPGDWLVCQSGQYRRNFYRLKNGVNLRAEARFGTEFISDGANCIFEQPDGFANKIVGLKANGPLLNPFGRSRWDMDWNWIVNFSRGSNPGAGQGIRSTTHGAGWISDGSIQTNNLWDDPAAWAIGAYQLVNSIFRFNRFACWNGIKADAFQGFHSNTYIEQNDFDGIGRDGTELQGRAERLWFQWNYLRNPRYGAQNDSCLGWSNILHGRDEHDLFYRYNTMDARDDGGENYTRLMFEMGNATLVEHNLCLNVGTFTSCFMGDSSGPQPESVILPSYVRNNKIVKSRYGQGSAYGQFPAKCTYSNNNANVVFPPEIKGIGVIPGPGKDVTAGTTFPPADLKLTATPQPATADIKTKGAQVKFAVSDMPALTKSIRIESRAKDQDGVTGPQVGPAPTYSLDELPAVGGMYHPAWEIDFRAVALDAAGKALATTAWVATPRMAGEVGPNGSDLAWPPVDQPPPPPGVTTENTIQRVVTDDELSALLRLRFANQAAALAVKVRVTAPAGDRTVAVAN